MTLTNGQARRIAAEWQAPRNAYSLLQHKGVISEDLLGEIAADLKSRHTDVDTARELVALAVWVEKHGPGKVADWGDWSDEPYRQRRR